VRAGSNRPTWYRQVDAHDGIDADHAFATAYAVVPFLCSLPHIVVAEYLIRRRGLPGLRFSPSPTASDGNTGGAAGRVGSAA
jgi:hypothetical protein